MANEKRLIDANKIPYHQFGFPKGDGFVSGLDWAFREDIEKLPTVDAVEVVRCKDCACYEETYHGYGYCFHWDYEQGMSPNQVESDDFCSYGERKDND